MMKKSTKKLALQHSGYTPGVEQWVCMMKEWLDIVQHNFYPSINHSILERFLWNDNRKPSISDLVIDSKYNVKLSQSYKDFLSIYDTISTEDHAYLKEYSVGLFNPSEVCLFSEYDADLFDIWTSEDHPVCSDKEYFRYGMEIDDSCIKAHFFKNALVIGKWGVSSFECILLFPDIRTIDGEMEAAYIQYGGVIRFPSFVELMRQFCYRDIYKSEELALASQLDLKNTVADKIKLSNVWWK